MADDWQSHVHEVLRSTLLGMMHMSSAVQHHEAAFPGDTPAIGAVRRAQQAFQVAHDHLMEMVKPPPAEEMPPPAAMPEPPHDF